MMTAIEPNVRDEKYDNKALPDLPCPVCGVRSSGCEWEALAPNYLVAFCGEDRYSLVFGAQIPEMSEMRRILKDVASLNLLQLEVNRELADSGAYDDDEPF